LKINSATPNNISRTGRRRASMDSAFPDTLHGVSQSSHGRKKGEEMGTVPPHLSPLAKN